SAWISGGKRRSDGYRDGTDFDENRAFAHALIPAAGGEVSLAAGVQDKVFGAYDFYAPSHQKDGTELYFAREWTTAQSGSITYRNGGITVRGYGRRHRDRFVLKESNPAFYDNRHRSLLAGTEAFVRLPIAGGDLAIGGEWVHEGIHSNNLGNRSRLRGSLFGEYGRALGARWRLLSGMRIDHHEDYGWEASPSLSASRGLGDGRVFFSAARSYRAPSFTETWYSDPNNVGNEDLGAERAWQFETGSSMAIVGTRLEGALFMRRESDLIDYVRPVGQPPWQADNLGAMETVGLRLRARRQWRSRIHLGRQGTDSAFGPGVQVRVRASGAATDCQPWARTAAGRDRRLAAGCPQPPGRSRRLSDTRSQCQYSCPRRQCAAAGAQSDQ
ncbi:MAG: TonB-dependent receptor, partial [bacterium]|nr:TonB-dependent receptor [bacterium]